VSAKVTRRTPQLDKAAELMKRLEGRWNISVECSEDSRRKLGWLAKRGRDFMQPSAEMTRTVVRFMRAALMFEPSMNERKLLAEGAQGARAEVLLRFTAQRGIPLRPLTAQYLASKIARGLDRRVGIAYRDLVTDLGACRWGIER
jgi:hypothetical protein